MFDITFEGHPDKHLQLIAAAIPEADHAGLEAVGTYEEYVVQRQIGRVYKRPLVPGQKARTGNLRSAPQKAQIGNGRAFVGFAGPALPYLWRRAKMGVLWFPRQQRAATIDYLGDSEQLLERNGPVVYEAAFTRTLDKVTK
jgi:hypothetical protein